MKMTYWHNDAEMRKEIKLTIDDATMFAVYGELDRFDHALLDECNKSGKISDFLLALELLARKREEQLEKQIATPTELKELEL